MNRRGFLAGILAAASAPAIVRIGSLMPVRSIVIPTTAEVVAVNSLLTIDMITREALRLAHGKAAFIGTINRQFDQWSAKKGDVLHIRRYAPYRASQ